MGVGRANAAGCDAREATVRSTKIGWRSAFAAVNRFAETVLKTPQCGTQIFTFSERKVPADFCDEAVTDSLGFKMFTLFTTCSHHARFRPQVRSESENHAHRCQDFSVKVPNIFPQKSLAVIARL